MKSGQGRTLPVQLGQLETGQDGKGLLQSSVVPIDLVRLLNRLDQTSTLPWMYQTYIFMCLDAFILVQSS